MPRRQQTRAAAILTAGALVVVGLAGQVARSTPAAAWPTTNVTITGHGYGHGRGMSQYGAYGYASSYGWDYTQILAHYYGGTHLAASAPTQIRVELAELAGTSLLVTSARTMTVAGATLAAGRAVQITVAGAGFKVATAASCTAKVGVARAIPATSSVPGGALSTIATVGAGGTAISSLLTTCSTRRSYRGTLSLVSANGALHVVNTLPLESYLRGVVPRESPASWGDTAGGRGINALRAQAVAARTYALAQHRYPYADICNNQNCQVYGGAGLNGALIEDVRTNRAVADTAGKVLRNSANGLVSAEYSSSSGGWTAGGAFPAVVDLGDVASPNHNWSEAVSASQISTAFGVGRLAGLDVLTRNGLGADGGRVTTIRVTGASKSVVVSGDRFQGALGLRSNWFSIARSPVTPTVRITNRISPTVPGLVLGFGWNGDIPLACDFDGDGRDTVAVFRSGIFYVRNSMDTGAPQGVLHFGQPGDLPVCGDWNGDHIDTFAVYRPSTHLFYLSNVSARPTVAYGTVSTIILLGVAADLPVAGDWNGAGGDTIGVFRPSTATYYLLAANRGTSPRMVYQYGGPGGLPLVGDFDGNGRDSVGAFRNGIFNVADQLGGKMSARWLYGQPGDLPLVGDWDGDGRTTAGVGRSYTGY